MAIDSGSLVGGAFVPTSMSLMVQVAAGQSGGFVSITPPANQRVRLLALGPTSTVNTEDDITISIGGVDVVSGGLTWNVDETDEFGVGFHYGSTGSAPSAIGVHPPIIGGLDEVILVEKTTGSTTNTIRYAYQFGVLK